jgi:hypothetical protein
MNHQIGDNKNECTKKIDIVLEQKYKKDIIDTGNHPMKKTSLTQATTTVTS